MPLRRAWPRILLGLIAGALVGAFGTAVHRSMLTLGTAPDIHRIPIGLALALALTICAALFVRAAAGFNTYAAFGIAWILMVQLLSMPNSGGDVLIVDPRAAIPWAGAGLIWTYAGAILLVLIALLPARWFKNIPDAVTTIDTGTTDDQPTPTPDSVPTLSTAEQPAQTLKIIDLGHQ